MKLALPAGALALAFVFATSARALPPGDAESDAAALLKSYEALSVVTDAAKRKEAQEKFSADCAKYVADYDGKVKEGRPVVALGLASMMSGQQEKGSKILRSE